MRFHPALLLALMVMGLALGAVRDASADDRIWTALVLATNENPPRPAPKGLEAFAQDLTKIFGYHSFYILGEKRQKIREGSEQWVVSSDQFFLKLACTDMGVTSYDLTIDLYAKEKLILTSRVRLARDAPLYIRGPQWGNGQLIYILEIR